MATDRFVGSVAGLWRFPVKSMRGERLDEVEVTERGLVGDRAYALVDADTGKVVSAKSVKLFPDILRYGASFEKPIRADDQAMSVQITFPNGTKVSSQSPDIDSALSASVGRNVSLTTAAPDNFTIDQYHPDVEDLDPAGHRDTVVEQKLGAAFYEEIGVSSPVPAGSFFDLFPVSVLTTSTLDRIGELCPESRFDERRFRMNVIIETEETGFVENEWIGRTLAIGDVVRLRIAMPDPRCVMTTLAQEELPRDANVLRTLTRYNRLEVGGAGLFPCSGVYAVVEAPGMMRAGDRVTLV